MSLFLPKGNFQNEVIDPEKLEKEWSDARKIAESAGSWQFLSGNSDSLTYSKIAENGSGVKIHHKSTYRYTLAGQTQNQDAPTLKSDELTIVDESKRPWQIPPLMGQKEIFDGDLSLSWDSVGTEMVLVGYSMWVYRLSSQYEVKQDSDWDLSAVYFPSSVQIRVKTGLKVDGSLIEGSGPGMNISTNGPEFVFGSGLSQKGFTATSDAIKMLRAGRHTVTPTAGMGQHLTKDRSSYYKTNTIHFNDELKDGVAVVNARVFAIRFPGGKLFGQ